MLLIGYRGQYDAWPASLRRQCGDGLAPHGIGVWLINPGFVATPLTAGNDFRMPALLTPEQAAQAILHGFARGRFEIHFPWRFTAMLKLLARLPYAWYFRLIHRLTGE